MTFTRVPLEIDFSQQATGYISIPPYSFKVKVFFLLIRRRQRSLVLLNLLKIFEAASICIDPSEHHALINRCVYLTMCLRFQSRLITDFTPLRRSSGRLHGWATTRVKLLINAAICRRRLYTTGFGRLLSESVSIPTRCYFAWRHRPLCETEYGDYEIAGVGAVRQKGRQWKSCVA